MSLLPTVPVNLAPQQTDPNPTANRGWAIATSLADSTGTQTTATPDIGRSGSRSTVEMPPLEMTSGIGK